MTHSTERPAKSGAEAGGCPFSHFDHHQLSLEENRRYFHDLHATGCPVAGSNAYGGFYVLAGFRDVRAASMDWRALSSAKGVVLPRMAEGIVALETDPPEHTQWRLLLQKAFLPKVLNAYKPEIEAIADQLVDQFAGRGHCDLVTEYAELLPIIAFFRLIGLDKDPHEILQLGSELTSAMKDPATYSEAFARLTPLALEELYKRRKNPGDDFLSICATAEFNGAPICDQEFVKLIAGLVTAGHESTATGISSLLLNVLPRPELRARIGGGDAKLETAAIEETLRINPPFLSFFRQTTGPYKVRDVEIPADTPVMLSYVGANHDPEEFEAPYEFRVDRPHQQHVAFGYGPHTCGGAPLARMEMRIALATILRRLPEIELASDRLASTIYAGLFVKALSLPARFPVG